MIWVTVTVEKLYGVRVFLLHVLRNRVEKSFFIPKSEIRSKENAEFISQKNILYANGLNHPSINQFTCTPFFLCLLDQKIQFSNHQIERVINSTRKSFQLFFHLSRDFPIPLDPASS